ncbi:MAG: LutB/LldF family L-lactate oxidation iron-sulfur protein [Rhodocyclaceae bacterium]|nr:LutB/LldF family L-lactate oxidation iron-sulfur protein [Rhodocyclaceae bacterium]
MELRSNEFKTRAAANLGDVKLQKGLSLIKVKAVVNRASAVAEFGDFETLREAGKDIRNRALADLDLYLECFEREATARGAVVHWAENASEACCIVVDIARQNGVKTVAKAKSMVSEEVGLNDALIEAGIEPIETDLGEYILQINDNEPPSHIVMPVIHKTAEDVADLFHAKHGTPRKTDPAALTREAREILRPKFLSADMGVSGANFLVAETGSTLIVTNEGNGRLCTTLPRIHVAITGIEKVVATLEDASTLLRLLPRSAAGQAITNYVSLHTGPKRLEESDGPQQFHIVLVDNGRAKLLAGEMREMLRCIRCGACMNHCPVYQAVGGHAWGWVYPGPMGNILTPSYVGLENAIALPNAATLCNQCGVVCPVKIPLADLMRKLREEQMERGLKPWKERVGLALWGWAAQRPALYAFGTRIAVRCMKWLGGSEKLIHRLPLASGWTDGRDFPAPEGQTFRELYAAKRRVRSEA